MKPNIMQLSRDHNIKYTTLHSRLKRGWSLERALSEPPQEQISPAHKRGVKRCSVCGIEKPVSEFTRLSRRSGNEYQSHCRECDNKRLKLQRDTLRLGIIRHYSNGAMQCQACNENRVQVLDLDHVHGGGKADRARFSTTDQFYRWIRDSHYPSGYRILCRNCNWIEHLRLNYGRNDA